MMKLNILKDYADI